MKIETKDLTCGYNKKRVVSDINFSVNSGEALCILGKNGIGKTTLLKTLLKRLPAVSGKVLIEGKPISEYSSSEMANIMSYIPQSKDYSYNYNSVDIVLMGKANKYRFYSSPKKPDIKEAVDILDELGLANLAYRNYSLLSGGEQQMILTARAMIQNARFILMDEPASNLDFNNQKQLISTIRLLKKRGVGILMISHNPDHGLLCCEKTLMINSDGSSVFGDTEDLINKKNLFDTFGVDMNIFVTETSDGKKCRNCGMIL